MVSNHHGPASFPNLGKGGNPPGNRRVDTAKSHRGARASDGSPPRLMSARDRIRLMTLPKKHKMKTGSYLKNTLLVLFFLSLASGLGLIRDRVLTLIIGLGHEADIYFSAFRIPDLLQRVWVGGVFSSVFLPLLSKNSGEERDTIMKGTFWALLISFTFILLSAYIILPYFLPFIFPGFSSLELSFLLKITYWLLLAQLFFALSFIPQTLLQYNRRFIWWSLPPLFYNLGIILGIVIGYPKWGLVGAIWGVLAGSFFYFVFSWTSALITGVSFRPGWCYRCLSVFREYLSKGIWPALGLLFSQLLLLGYLGSASFLDKGEIGIFSLAFNLQRFPVVLLGVGLSSVGFSFLSSSFWKNKDRFSEELGEFTLFSLLFSIAVAGFVFLYAPEIAWVLWRSSLVSPEILKKGIWLLRVFSLSIPFFVPLALFHRGFHSQQLTSFPLISQFIAFIGAFFVLVTGFALVPSDSKIFVLSFSWVVYGFVQFLAQLYFLKKKNGLNLKNKLLSSLLIGGGFIVMLGAIKTLFSSLYPLFVLGVGFVGFVCGSLLAVFIIKRRVVESDT